MQARHLKRSQERIIHDERVHYRKNRKVMEKERHESITDRLKGWIESISKKRKQKRSIRVLDQLQRISDERKD